MREDQTNNQSAGQSVLFIHPPIHITNHNDQVRVGKN